MKKFYPELKTFRILIIAWVMAFIFSLLCLLPPSDPKLKLLIVGLLGGLALITLAGILTNSSLIFQDNVILYKPYLFSKTRELPFSAIKHITFDYWRGWKIEIDYRNDYVQGNKNRRFILRVVDITLMEEFFRQFPKELFSLNLPIPVFLSKREKEFLLKSELLTQKQQEYLFKYQNSK
ncbi:MAG: hypothetical protein IJW96_05870 [Clostridia bacterium]|nr:hypothetical protein [Clostridia bacterium]